MPQLFSAHLRSDGPNYAAWLEILGRTKVPLLSAQPVRADFGDEKNVEVYMLDLRALTLGVRARLVASLAKRFAVPIYEIDQELEARGCPIRAADIVVAIDARAFA